MSFGRYLKGVRKSRGISLEKLAEEIRVTPRQLTWIEAEDFDRMPAEVYAKGILRAYAETVEVDPEDIIGRFRLDLEAWEKAVKLEEDALRSGKKNFFRMVAALSVLGVIIATSLYVAGLLESGPGHGKETESARSSPSENRSQQHASSAENEGTFLAGRQAGEWMPESEMQVLSVDAVSEATLNIAVDGGEYTKYRLDPKDHLELAAQVGFRIAITDPSAVRVKLNGRQVEIEAEQGQPAKIVLSEKAESR